MKTWINPAPGLWPEILERPLADYSALTSGVSSSLNAIRQRGRGSLRELTLRFDGTEIWQWEVTAAELEEAEALLDPALKEAIGRAAANIGKFHGQQLQPFRKMETMPGVWCWQKAVPIERIGLYIPGECPLFSTVLMLAVPARLAGCCEVILCTPPAKDGSIHPAILYAAKHAGVTRIFRLGAFRQSAPWPMVW